MTLTTIKKAGLDEIALDHVFTIGALANSSAYTFQGEGLNGTVNNPTLYLTRGKTYRFENGSGGHPLRIQSTSGQSGTAYNTGVTNNNSTGTVIVEVQHDAPDVLYYQCTSHAAMNGILYTVGALADGGVTTAKLANDAVTTAKIADDAVTSAKIADGAVINARLGDDSVTSAKIDAGAVDATALASNAVTTAKISAGAVTNAKLGDDSITAAKIDAGAVGTEALATDAVTQAKIADGAIDSARLASNAVTGAKIATGAINNANKIQDSIITGAKIGSGTITNANIAANTITDSLISGMAASKLTGALPAISGANLTNLPGGGKVLRVIQVNSTGEQNYYYYSQGNPWITTGSIQGVSANSRFLIFGRFDLKLEINHNSVQARCNFGSGGGNVVGGESQVNQTTTYVTTSFTAYDTASSTSNRSYYFNVMSTGTSSARAFVRNGLIVVLELDVS